MKPEQPKIEDARLRALAQQHFDWLHPDPTPYARAITFAELVAFGAAVQRAQREADALIAETRPITLQSSVNFTPLEDELRRQIATAIRVGAPIPALPDPPTEAR